MKISSKSDEEFVNSSLLSEKLVFVSILVARVAVRLQLRGPAAEQGEAAEVRALHLTFSLEGDFS